MSVGRGGAVVVVAVVVVVAGDDGEDCPGVASSSPPLSIPRPRVECNGREGWEDAREEGEERRRRRGSGQLMGERGERDAQSIYDGEQRGAASRALDYIEGEGEGGRGERAMEGKGETPSVLGHEGQARDTSRQQDRWD